jgi:type IV pilus assembly protein PilA
MKVEVKRSSKSGFTLVELLAVIVILAIILAIAIPGISGLINSSTKNAFESDAKMLLKQIDYKMMEDSSLNLANINVTNLDTSLNLSNSNYQTVSVTTLNGKPYVVLQGKNKWSGLVAYGSYASMNVTDSSSYTTVVNQLSYDSNKGVNEPKLTPGMTPIKWNTSTNTWVDTTASDSDWYDYSAKNWANARTADGSMWVWIPRYVYRISSNWHVNTTGTIDVQFSKGTDDNWNSAVIGNIDTGTTSSASNVATNTNKYTNQPAFDFGATTHLTGFWMAKFEPTAVEGIANGYTADSSCPTAGDNVTTKTVKVIPNVASWRCIQVGNAFTVSRNMENNSTYGWGTTGTGIDTHLMKNTEWGAVAYLSKSTYGQNTNEIWINNTNDYTTGCAANSATQGASTTGCLNAYNTTNGVKASSTGTIYGVYDMSGGSRERTSAYVDNANSNLNTFGAPIISAASQYKDIYTKGTTDDQTSNYALTINQKGDAVYETSNSYTGTTSWFGDYSNMLNTSGPWFIRGGGFNNGSTAGAFGFYYTNGSPYSHYSFRPVLLVGTGL